MLANLNISSLLSKIPNFSYHLIMKKTAHKKVFTRGRTAALLAAAALTLSAFLPWGYNENVMVTGLDGDGFIVIGLGIFAFLLLFIKKVPIIINLVIAGMGLILGFTVYGGMYTATKIINGQIGFGIYLTITASILMILAVTLEIFDERKKRKQNLYYADEE